jgi:hypothetical protein
MDAGKALTDGRLPPWTAAWYLASGEDTDAPTAPAT